MSKFISNTVPSEGYKVGAPRPIDDRIQWETVTDLMEYTQSNRVVIYEGLVVYTRDNQTHYRWEESVHGLFKEGTWPYAADEIGRYPPDYRPIGDDGPDYSNKFFNWVIADESVTYKVVSTGETKFDFIFDLLPHKMINRPDTSVAYMAEAIIRTGTNGESFYPDKITWVNNEYLEIRVSPAFPVGEVLTIKIS